jgi:polyisoprenoid-binding protein YceI
MEITFHDDVGMTAHGRNVASFSAYGKFKRSDFAIVYGLDRIGIRRMDDEVTVLIDVAGNRRD